MEVGMKKIGLCFALCAMLSLAACAQIHAPYGQQGAIGGAAAGALIGQAIGRSTEATLIGVAIGTVLGYIVGNEMDKYDRSQLGNAVSTVPSGQTYAWQNPDTRNVYQVTPQPAYIAPPARRGQPERICRQAESIADIAGVGRQITVTTACFNEHTQQWELAR